MKSLDGQVILITGAGGGFGREMIRQFLDQGGRLILADLRSAPIEQAVEWASAGRGAQTRGAILGRLAVDLAEPGGGADLAERALALAPVDLLVNNAGIGLFGSIEAIPPARWEALMQINLLAPIRLTAALLPQMIARRGGHIANVASVAGLVGAPGLAAYCAAKFGLRGFAEALAADVRAHGIDVTTIYPFFARTPILNAERFGTATSRQIPERLIYDPAFVVAQLIDGIRRRKQHVYPGAVPRQIDILRRVAPWALRWLQ
jgi:NAD(P)-dependent dehydrogenase (short-subunit alcohol dehydrogenase family)